MLPPLAQRLLEVDRILVSPAALARPAYLCYARCVWSSKAWVRVRKKVNPHCARRFVDTHSFDIFKTPDIPEILERTALL